MTIIELFKKVGRIPAHIKHEYGYLRIIAFRLLSCFFPSTPKVWLFLERGNDAQDNAWHLFKYMVRDHPDIQVKFAINMKSPDYESNLNGYNQYVINYNSFEYYRYLFHAKAVVSTHVDTFTTNGQYSRRLRESIFKFKAKIIFLQHGITRQNCPEFEFPNYGIDLFVCGAQNEYKLLNQLLHYPQGYLVYTGFPRYDNLISFTTKKQILIMPTWRKKYNHHTIEQFAKTDFYGVYSELLSNEKLIDFLRKTGYSIKYYNHFEFQKFNSLFEKFNCDVIQIGRFGEKRVQDLLKESDVLVTDYSSIYYDFMYMMKPVLFLHFDYDEFEKTQYGKRYDLYSEFGDVSTSAKQITSAIIKSIENKCVMDQKYLNKVSEIFKYRDTNNSQRVYEQILRKLS